MMHERPGLTGSILDKYELLEKVGEGGMAEVYRARHKTLDRVVAVKVLHPHLSNVERNRLRFEREARAIESLQHENILRIEDYSGRDSKTCFIVTEFIDGQTLKELLVKETRLPSEVAAIIGIALCRALAYAHERHIIHRDIKPENVMIRVDGVVKLMDFGIARVLDESSMTLTGGLVGSPAYMSPEQASDQELDHRTDLFSLGTLLYRTVTGHLPFTGSSAPVILRNILEGHYVDPLDLEPALAPELAEVIQQTLTLRPEDRFGSAQAVEAALRRVLEVSGVSEGSASLCDFLQDSQAYRASLNETLCRKLPEVGKALIARGQNMAAMKVFNRVLVLDEENVQVREQIAKLYEVDESFWQRRKSWVLGGGVLLGVGGLVLLWNIPALFESVEIPGAAMRAGVLTTRAGSIALSGAGQQPTGVQGPSDAALGQAAPGAAVDAKEPPPTPNPRMPAESARALENPAVSPSAKTPPPPRVPDPALSAGAPARSPEPLARPLREQRAGAQTPLGTARGPGEGPQRGEKPGLRVPTEPVESARAPIKKVDLTPALLQVTANYQAELFLNGVSYGNLGLLKGPLSLNPGGYRLRLVNASCDPLEESLTLAAGSIFEKRFELKGCRVGGEP